MTPETQPLRLLPYRRRLLADGRSVIEPETGESFELPSAYQAFFDAAEKGASLSQMTDLVRVETASGSGRRFERLRRFLIFLNDRDLIADRAYRRLADSLSNEFIWPASVATTPLFETTLIHARPNPKSFSTVGEITAAVIVMVVSIWSASVLPLAANAQIAEHITGLKLLGIFFACFWGGRTVLAIFSWIVPFFAGTKAELSFQVEPLGPRFKTEQKATPYTPLTFVSLVCTLLSASLLAKIASLTSDAITASWFAVFAWLAVLTEASPFSRTAFTDLLRSAYAKNANERGVRSLHVASSYIWTAVFGLSSVIFIFPALASVFVMFKSAGGADKVGCLLILAFAAFLVLSWLVDLFSAFSYDDKTEGAARRLWMTKSKSAVESVRSTQPSASDLEKLPFLRQIDAQVRQKLIDLAEVTELSEGQAITRQGSKDRSLFVVLEGRLAVAKFQSGAGGSRRRKVVAFLDPGAVFGEAAFFFGQPRTADVVAMEDSRVLKIPHIDEMRTIDESKSAELQARIWFLQALMTSSTFKELPGDALDAILLAGQRQVFAAGQRVMQEGEAGDACYFIVQGQASVSQNTVSINKMKAGDAFGEIAVLNPGTLRTATVTADSELITIRIDAQRFWILLKSHLPLALEIERLAQQRIQRDAERAKRKAQARQK